MQLKEEFRTYEALRREHDAQIVHIAMEAGLRISPEQWSSLLYGDLVHKSHMQSIIDKVSERARKRRGERQCQVAEMALNQSDGRQIDSCPPPPAVCPWNSSSLRSHLPRASRS